MRLPHPFHVGPPGKTSKEVAARQQQARAEWEVRGLLTCTATMSSAPARIAAHVVAAQPAWILADGRGCTVSLYLQTRANKPLCP